MTTNPRLLRGMFYAVLFSIPIWMVIFAIYRLIVLVLEG